MLHHVRFQAKRCAHFYGRQELLMEAMEIVCTSPKVAKAPEPSSYSYGSRPMVQPSPYAAITLCLVGVSGSGKTSFMSMLATALRAKVLDSTPVIIRYCGTSSMSCDGISLVRSLIWQIRSVYGAKQDSNAWPVFEKYAQAVQALHALLEKCPVVLLIATKTRSTAASPS